MMILTSTAFVQFGTPQAAKAAFEALLSVLECDEIEVKH